MAKPEVESLKERKARLSMESDTLRYHFSRHCAELEGPATVLVQGLQVATRLRSTFFRFPLFDVAVRKRRNKLGILTHLVLQFLKR